MEKEYIFPFGGAGDTEPDFLNEAKEHAVRVRVLLQDEGFPARLGKTAKYPFCVVTNAEGKKYLTGLGFITSSAKLI